MNIEVLDPTGRAVAAADPVLSALAPRRPVTGIARIGLLDSLKAGAAHLLSGVRGELEQSLDAEIVYWQKVGELGSNGPLEFADEIAKNVDAVVNAVGDCGSCTSWTVHDSVVLERLGVPTVTMVTQPFETLAHARCESLGMPDLRIVVVPHPVYTRTQEELEGIARERFSEIRDALTGPAAEVAGSGEDSERTVTAAGAQRR